MPGSLIRSPFAAPLNGTFGLGSLPSLGSVGAASILPLASPNAAGTAELTEAGTVLPSEQTAPSLPQSLLTPGLPALPVTGLSAQPAEADPSAARTKADAGATAQETLELLGEKVAAKTGKQADPVPAALDTAFDGRLERSDTVQATPFSGHEGKTRTHQSAALRPAAFDQLKSGTQVDKPETEKPSGKMPFSYYLYLGSQFLYAVGQEATSIIAPLYAFFTQGLAFAVTVQAAFLIAIIPGSLLGAKWIKKFDAKKVYLVGNILHGVFALSVPLIHLLTGYFSPIHFVITNIVGGFIYGALRGVAEKEIAPRIVGQENLARLNKAGSMFYAAFEGAELVAALTVAAALPLMGLNPTALIMAAVILTSIIPLWFMRLKRATPVEGEAEKGGTERKLPWMTYFPYVFAVFSHLALYMFLAPFLALEVFQIQALNGYLIAAYTAGSLIVALVTAYAPKLTGKISDKGWAGVGMASMFVFMWVSLLLGSPALALTAALGLGIGLTAMQIQWRSRYQQRLAMDAQPGVFKWLSIAGVLAILPPFAFMQAGLAMGWSMPFLLTVLAGVITIAGLAIPFYGWLKGRLKK